MAHAYALFRKSGRMSWQEKAGNDFWRLISSPHGMRWYFLPSIKFRIALEGTHSKNTSSGRYNWPVRAWLRASSRPVGVIFRPAESSFWPSRYKFVLVWTARTRIRHSISTRQIPLPPARARNSLPGRLLSYYYQVSTNLLLGRPLTAARLGPGGIRMTGSRPAAAVFYLGHGPVGQRRPSHCLADCHVESSSGECDLMCQ